MNPSGKKLISLFLVFSLLMINCVSLRTTGGKEKKRGALIVITKKDGQLIQGELIAVKQDSLLVLDTEGKDVSTYIIDIKFVRIGGKSGISQGMKIGFFIGGLSGVIIGASTKKEEEEEIPIFLYIFFPILLLVPIFERVGNTVIGGSIGGGGGLIVGGVLGGVVEKTRRIRIEGKSQEEIDEIIEKLRKKARVRNYK